MTNFKAVITDKNSPDFGKSIGNTKSPGKFKGMPRDVFFKAIRYTTAYSIEIKTF